MHYAWLQRHPELLLFLLLAVPVGISDVEPGLLLSIWRTGDGSQGEGGTMGTTNAKVGIPSLRRFNGCEQRFPLRR